MRSRRVKGGGCAGRSRCSAIPNCPYCKLLDDELAKLDNVTIYTFLLPWVSPESRRAAEAAWARAHPERAQDSAVLDRNLRLAAQVGLRGTPTADRRRRPDQRRRQTRRRTRRVAQRRRITRQPPSQAASTHGGHAMSPHRSRTLTTVATWLPHRGCLRARARGCASMAGVGGSAEFGCKAPVGVQCDSVSGNYYNAVQRNLPLAAEERAAPQPEALGEPSTRMERSPRKACRSGGVFEADAAPAGNPVWDHASP